MKYQSRISIKNIIRIPLSNRLQQKFNEMTNYLGKCQSCFGRCISVVSCTIIRNHNDFSLLSFNFLNKFKHHHTFHFNLSIVTTSI